MQRSTSTSSSSSSSPSSSEAEADPEDQTVSSFVISHKRPPKFYIHPPKFCPPSPPMANETISKPLPQEILKYIPRYEGTAYKLPNFILTCEEIFTTYCNEDVREATANHWLLFKAALYHLEGPAEAVAYNNNCQNISELLHALKRNFADNRTIPDLIAELAVMKSYPKEHPIEFINRLDEKRTTVITRYRIDGISGELLKQLTDQLNATLVRTLIHGVHPSLGSHLQVLQIQDLEDARSKLINDCSIILDNLKYSTSIDIVNKLDLRKYNQPSMPFRIPNHDFTRSRVPVQNFQGYSGNIQPPAFSWPGHSFQNPNSQQQNYFRNQTPNFRNPQPHFQAHNFTHTNTRPQYNQISNNRPQYNPKWNSQNTVSMRTVRSNKPFQKRDNFISPYEITYLEEEKNNESSTESIRSMQGQINSLTEAVSKLTTHFLEQGHSFPEDPPPNSS